MSYGKLFFVISKTDMLGKVSYLKRIIFSRRKIARFGCLSPHELR